MRKIFRIFDILIAAVTQGKTFFYVAFSLCLS